jgi:hypothetical protein
MQRALLLLVMVAALLPQPAKGDPQCGLEGGTEVPVAALEARAGEALLRLGKATDPAFAGTVLRGDARRLTPALRAAEKAGAAVWDLSSKAWFATVNGVLVRVGTEGRLEARADNVQGTDVDVRAAAGVAVSREPDDTIVLHRLAGDGGRTVLLSGPAFFHPRFSPDGDRMLVHESRSEGGRLWLVEVGGAAKVLCQGYAGAWHPDGRRILFARIGNDSERVTGAELFELDLVTGKERQLTATAAIHEVEPAVSPDGRWLAAVDAATGELIVIAYPEAGEEVTP